MIRVVMGVLVLVILPVLFLANVCQAEIEQTIDEFTLSGFEQKGKLAWEINGRAADIFSEQIKLNDFSGIFYGQEKINIDADRGDFNRAENKVHLEDNVVITTESGARITTDYLDWDKETSLLTTEAPVDIYKDNIVTTGIGIKGRTDLQQIDLKQDVRLQVNDPQHKIVVTCDGPLSIDYAANIAVFYNNVAADDGESQMYSDLMEVYFQTSGLGADKKIFAGKNSKIDRIIAKGNVKIVREGNSSFSDEAIYNTDNKTIVLTGRPQLVIDQSPSAANLQ